MTKIRFEIRVSFLVKKRQQIQSLNDAAADKVRKYRADYNNRPPSTVLFRPTIVRASGRLHSEFVRLLFLQTHRETDRFFFNFRSSTSTYTQVSSLKGPTSPRIVTRKHHSKYVWNAAHCTVNTFIHKHPNHLTVPRAWSKSF